MGAPKAERASDMRITLDALTAYHPRGKAAVVATAGFSVMAGVLEAATLVIITTVAVGATQEADDLTIGPLTASPRVFLTLALLLLVALLVAHFLQSRTTANVISTACRRARTTLISNFHNASYERKSQDRTANVQEALTTYIDRLAAAFTALTNYLSGAINLITFAITALVVDVTASVAMAAVGGLTVLVLRPAARLTRRSATLHQARRKDYAARATESVLLAREESVFGVSDVAGARLREVDLGVVEQYRRTRFLASFVPRVYQNLAFMLAVIALFALTSLNPDDLTSIGAVVLLLVRSISFAQVTLQNLQALSEHAAYLVPLQEMTESYAEASQPAGDRETGPIERIDLRSVGFAYLGERPALHDVTFAIERGECIGVLGPSGAGKSTLVNLLLRLYQPTSGQILVNDVPLPDVLPAEWHRRTAIVPQEARLLHGSIADNIRFLREISDADLETAARDAHALEFIEQLPDGLAAEVGELGAGLSGGQRQRICIARALAGGPDVLVLDEPTSALDGESEAAIQATLEALKGRVTMVIVAHRLSTLNICDRLVVLKDGELVGLGAPEELAASSTYYREALRLAGL